MSDELTEEAKLEQEKFKAGGFESFNMTKNLFLYLFAIAVSLLVVVVMLIVAIVPSVRRKILKKLKKVKKDFVWNGYIRSTLFTYMKQFVSFALASTIVDFSDEQL